MLPTVIPTLMPMLGPSWLDPANMITAFVGWVGPWAVLGVCLVIFAETGLLIGFFLPGDSLLFTLGMFSAVPTNGGDPVIPVPLWLTLIAVAIAAVAGDQVGYWIGREAGPKVFDKPDSRIFKQEYVERTSNFFNKYGGRTIILARFVPIVRTFAPVMAGVGKMKYGHFVSYNVFGGLLWAPLCTILGYLLGNVTFVQQNIDLIIVLIVLVSVAPMFIHALSTRIKKKRAEAAGPVAAADAGPSTPGDGDTHRA